MRVTRDGLMFDYIAKEGKHRELAITDEAVLPTVRALSRSGNDWTRCLLEAGRYMAGLRSHDVSGYIAAGAGGH